ncbi:MAG TPA: hypothetical protein PKV48_03820 [Thermodesulfobacteriota bacterium]|nr:hypothetical protein [Thermodesulfobacteriota bacterium]
MYSNNKSEIIITPPLYKMGRICPAIRDNDRTKEVVWTYLVAKRYKKNLSALVKCLCGCEEKLPDDPNIWLEAYLYPTQRLTEEEKYWKTRADLAIGFLENVPRRENQIRAKGDWLCIAESKWFDDIHKNSRFPETYQLSQLIEHAILLSDINGEFPKRVYVSLITPRYFKERLGQFSRNKVYQSKYECYKSDKKSLEDDLRLCTLHFNEGCDLETLISRIDALRLNWVTFEELLRLSNLVQDHIPGKYKVTRDNWVARL